jgi:hypothetical protein
VRRQPGDFVVRREVWHDEPKVGWSGIVVEDTKELLALYMPEASPFGFADDFFGAPHPWSHRGRWEGNGVLQLQRPGEMHAVWVFWHGPEREFRGWYVNLQEPFRRTRLGFDTQDLELDILVGLDGSWRFKDDEKLESWIDRGRWSVDEVDAIRREGARLGAEFDAGLRWWDDEWATWTPDPRWRPPTLPADWDACE